jgi:hypothetical protein
MSDNLVDNDAKAFIVSLKQLARSAKKKAKEEERKIPLVTRNAVIEPASVIRTEAIILGQLSYLYELNAGMFELLWELTKRVDATNDEDVKKTMKDIKEQFEKNKRAFRFVNWLASEHEEPTSQD